MRIGIITEFIEKMPTAMNIYVRNIVEHLLNIIDKSSEIILIHSAKSIDPLFKTAGEMVLPFDDPIFLSKILDAKFDVIHIPYLIYGMQNLMKSLHKKVKLICTMHGIGHSRIPPELYYNAYSLMPSKVTLRILEFYIKVLSVIRLKCKILQVKDKFDLMITISNSAKRDISIKFSISEEKIRVIYHGVANHFRPLKSEEDIIRTLEKYKIMRPFILSVSGYNSIKNIIRLIKSFRKFKTKRKMKQKLVIAAIQSNGIRKIINSLSLQDEVILPGFIDNTELPQLYNAADILIFPSLHETFGMPILEAMSCGCPVITSNVSSMPEIAGDAAVLVNPYNVNEIERAIYQVLNDKGSRENMKKKGLQRAKQFSWRKCAEEHLKVYQEVL